MNQELYNFNNKMSKTNIIPKLDLSLTAFITLNWMESSSYAGVYVRAMEG